MELTTEQKSINEGLEVAYRIATDEMKRHARNSPERVIAALIAAEIYSRREVTK